MLVDRESYHFATTIVKTGYSKNKSSKVLLIKSRILACFLSQVAF